MGARRRVGLSGLALLSLALVGVGCRRVPNAGAFQDGGPNPCAAQPAGLICYGTEATQCDGHGGAVSRTDCAASGQVCAPDVGCRVCVPRQVSCDGETVILCNDDGSAQSTGPTCNVDAGQHCSVGGCMDLCALAVADHSYIGCEYFPTVLPNSEVDSRFHFAVVIANPQLVPAQVTILKGEDVVDRVVVDPGGLAVRELEWIAALHGSSDAPGSVLVPDGAYHLVSDVPVTVTQFDALEYQRDATCDSLAPENGCFSYTNDASLLLPSHVLTGSYLVMARATHVLDGRDLSAGTTNHSASPGFATIVNVEDHAISVLVHSTAYTMASADGLVPALSPGEDHEFTLGIGDVLVLASADPGTTCPGETSQDTSATREFDYCNAGPEYDLTGTEIRSYERIAVFGGHNCTFVPYNRWACDHLEEQLFPVESMGQQLFVPVTHPLRMGEPNLLRVVAAGETARVTFTPPLEDGTTTVDLVRGQYTEHEVRSDVLVQADAPILGALYLVGQNYLGFDTVATSRYAVGDPAMALVVPTEQYRRSYEFLAPETYPQSYVGVAIPTGGQIYLDGAPITGQLTPSTAMMSVGQIRIPTGPHSITGDHGFGVYVYGFGSYTSYFVPGGLDFRPITPPF
ncbi:MAG: IgGFc-binding protein [Sandaracinus sp.]